MMYLLTKCFLRHLKYYLINVKTSHAFIFFAFDVPAILL